MVALRDAFVLSSGRNTCVTDNVGALLVDELGQRPLALMLEFKLNLTWPGRCQDLAENIALRGRLLSHHPLVVFYVILWVMLSQLPLLQVKGVSLLKLKFYY
jgi:hypothetical protein